MSYRLFVRPLPPFPESAEQRFSWVLQDAGGDAQAQGESDLREEIEQALARNSLENVALIGLIPADDTVFCVADIPARQRRYVIEALPYAVEEQVAQDIESLHFAIGEHTADGYQVAAIDKARMAHWKRLFSSWQGTDLVAIHADAALLPETDNGWTLCQDRETVLMRSSQGDWLAVKSENLAMFAQTMATPSTNDVATQVPVRLFVPTEAPGGDHGPRQLALASDRLLVTEEPLELTVAGLLAWSYHHQLCRPINLCQGVFSTRPQGRHPLSSWKPLIAVVALWFLVQVALEIGFGLYHRQLAEQSQAQAMAIYRQAFPEDNRTHAGNVRRVVQGQLRAAESSSPRTGFIALLKFTGEQYSRLGDNGVLAVNAINYTRAEGELVVDILADDYEQMSRLSNGLTDEGLQAEIGSVVNDPGGTRGRLTVSGGE